MLERRFAWCLVAALVIAPAVRAVDPPPTTKIAHIKLSGSIEEGPAPEDPFGSSHENFKAKLDRIHKAKTDKEVQALYLEIDDLGAGWGQLDELSKAVADFRSSGKKAYAYLEGGDAHDYLVAIACDEVCLPEPGSLMLTGLRAEVTFYKDLFEKIGVKADFLQMGDFKGAAEPYTRNKLSEANRQQLESILDDRYDQGIIGRIVRGRPAKKYTPEQVKKLIDCGPYSARAALQAGLVDHLAYPDKFEGFIKERVKGAKSEIVRNYGEHKKEDIDLSTISGIMKLFAPPKTTKSSKPKVAVIFAVGAITTGKSGAGLMGDSVGSTTIVEAIRQAEKDETVKAIVLRVDSPGGSALASDLIWKELKNCKKPVIASMGDVAASGGYYISMAARKIYADPGTLTGSIGVIGGKLALGGLFENIGIRTEVLQRGANAGIFSSTHGFTPSQKEAFRAMMQDTYDQFLDKALAGRKAAGKTMTREQLVKLAGGHVWTGRQAKQNGLIDELGGLDDAIAAAKQLGGLPADKEPDLLELPKPRHFLDSFLENQLGASVNTPEVRLLRRLPGMRQHLGVVEGLLQLRGEAVWLTMPYGLTLE
jgi:protease-4